MLSQLQLLSGLDAVESIDFLALNGVEVAPELLRELERQVPKLQAHNPIIRNSSVRRSRTTLFRFLSRRLLHNDPYLIAINHLPEMESLIERVTRDKRHDVVYVGYLGMMSYLPQLRRLVPNATFILEQHNLEWQIFERLAGELRSPLREVVKVEARALRRRERQALRQVDSVIAISNADAQQFRDLAGIEPVVVPPFIELLPPRDEKPSEPQIGYVGLLAWQPNVFGLNWFCRDVWPLVRAVVPNASMTIAGSGLRRLPSGALDVPQDWQQPGITTVGFVDDLNELYKNITGMVAPVVGGSGVRMKLLETLRAGMPTVTTTDGAAGLSVAHEREMLIADGPQSFANCVIRLMNDGHLRRHLRDRGYEYLIANHSAKVASQQLSRALSKPSR